MGILEALKRDSMWYLAGHFVSRAAVLLMLPLYSRWLLPAEFGTIDYVLACTGIAAVLVSGEIGQGLARFYAGEQDPSRRKLLASTALWFATAMSSVGGLVLLFGGPWFSRQLLDGGNAGRLVVVMVLLLVSQCISQILHFQLRWSGRAAEAMVASTAMAVTNVLAGLVLIGAMNLGAGGFLFAQVIANVTLGLVSYSFGSKFFSLRFSAVECRRMLAFSVPLIPSSLAVTLAMLVDRFLIDHLLSRHDLGLYGVAIRFAAMANLMLVPFRAALTPLVYGNYHNQQTANDLAALLQSMLRYGGPAILLATVFSPEIYAVLVARGYWAGHSLLGLSLLGVVLNNLYMFTPGLDIARKTWVITLINLLALTVNLIVNVLLLPRIGIIASALALCAGGMVMFLGYSGLGRRHYRVNTSGLDLAMFVLPTMAVTLLIHFARVDGPGASPYRFAVAAVLLLAMALLARRRSGVAKRANRANGLD